MQRVFVTLFLALLPGVARAQTNATPAKTPAFDVVSIHENKSDNVVREYGPTASGYRGRGEAPLTYIV